MTKPSIINWTRQPGHGHAVQLYQKDSDFIQCLTSYVSEGLRGGETCLIIAATEHIERLEDSLHNMFDLRAAARDGRYLVLDARWTLERFMVEGMPDEARFAATVGRLVKECAADDRSVRVYGEMVALLWRDGNLPAMLSLEGLWNRLGQQANFSLLCAYPAVHFMFDRKVRDQVIRRHDVLL